MGLFSKTSSAEKLVKKIDQEYWWRFNKTQKEKSLNEQQKKLILAVLTSAKVIAWSLIQNFTHPEHDFSKHINERADAFGCFLFACYIQLSGLKMRLKNSSDFTKKIGVDFEWVLNTTASILEIDVNTYFGQLFRADEKTKTEKIDPRDLWVEQDEHFYKKIFKEDFNLENRVRDDMSLNLTLSMLSINIRTNAAKVFDEALISQK